MKSDQLIAAAAGVENSAVAPLPQEAEGAVADAASFLDGLSAIEWIDWTAVVLLSVFFLLGLFKGFVWQVSRMLTLVGAWLLAGRYGPDGEALLNEWFGTSTSADSLHLFLAYVVIFVFAVVVFSLIAWLLQKLVRESGLTAYDRLGGAVLGLGTGSLGVVVILAGLFMFIPEKFGIVQAAQRSRSMQFSQQALQLLGKHVPEPMRQVFRLKKKDRSETGDGESKGK